jgi:hypothetical protein
VSSNSSPHTHTKGEGGRKREGREEARKTERNHGIMRRKELVFCSIIALTLAFLILCFAFLHPSLCANCPFPYVHEIVNTLFYRTGFVPGDFVQL